ncbi:MAG: fatty-acid oxidation protein subunit alpha [Cyanobacteria bacterium RI_101]|nr:fatty-acid oxidation protein subunit alpha [Cyanobacteria bacterium RI_101]
MSARDATHSIVKHALEKEGWRITHDPYYLKVGGIEFYIDLGTEMIIAAERDNQKIAVEVKSFLGPSSISEFHTALGQFINYRYALEKKTPNRVLYLAVPSDIYDDFFTLSFIKKVIQKSDVKLIIYQENKEIISQWIN